MKNYKDPIYKYLSDYKKKVLAIEEDGIFKNNGKKYSHILPEEIGKKNIIESIYYDKVIQYLEKDTIQLHHGFHHLNSSQALCFNLLVPMIEENKLETIFDLLSENDQAISVDFEHVYDVNESTNFDFYILGEKKKYFFEVKYTEDRFASTKKDDRHLEKYRMIYKERLQKIGEIPLDLFLKNYQLWRNLIYSQLGIVVFVIPKFRTDLVKQINIAISMMNDKTNVKILYIEDLCAQNQIINNEKYTSHYNEFYKKYLEVGNYI